MTTVRTGVVTAILLGLLMSVLLWVTTSPAHAQTVDECQTEINDLKTATQTATFIGQNDEKDKAGLIGKLDSANTKLDQGKFADALANLQSFRNKVEALDQQGKIAHAGAESLIAEADQAIACVQDLIDAQAASAA